MVTNRAYAIASSLRRNTMGDAENRLVSITKIADAVTYQAGSIVSREIVNRPTGTVTLFAFDAGQGLSEHTAPFDALVHVVDGEADITISGKKYHLAQGEMIVMPANEPHALKAEKPFKMLLVMIRS
jgi:quercetin dioxygenase-like cupin family protein